MLRLFDTEQFNKWIAADHNKLWYNLSEWHTVVLPDHVIQNRAKDIHIWCGEHVQYEVICCPNHVTIPPTKEQLDSWNRKFQEMEDDYKERKTATERKQKILKKKLLEENQKVTDAESALEAAIAHEQACKEEVVRLRSKREGIFHFFLTEEERKAKYARDSAVWRVVQARSNLEKAEKAFQEYKEREKRSNHTDAMFEGYRSTKWEIFLQGQPRNRVEQQGYKFYFAKEVDAVAFKLEWMA